MDTSDPWSRRAGRTAIAVALALLAGCASSARRSPAPPPPAPPFAACASSWRVVLDEALPVTAFLDNRIAPAMWVSPLTGAVEVVVAEAAEGGGAMTSAVWISEVPGRWRPRGPRLDFAQEPVAVAGDYLAVGQRGYRGDDRELDVQVYRHLRGAWRPADRLRHASVSQPGLGIDEAGRLSGFFGDDRGEGRLRHLSADGAWTPIIDLDRGGMPRVAVTPRGLGFVGDRGLCYREPPAAVEVVTAAPGVVDELVVARSGAAAMVTRVGGHIAAHVRGAGGWQRRALAADPPRAPWPPDCALDCPPMVYESYALGGIAGRGEQPVVLLLHEWWRAVRTVIHGSTGSFLTEQGSAEATSLVVADLARDAIDELALARPLAPTKLAIEAGPAGVVHVLAEEAPSTLRHIMLTCAAP